MTPVWFLYLGGFSLAILGVLQILTRPRSREGGIYERFVNVGTLWSLLCITVGAGLVLMALGYWSGPLDMMHPPAAPSPTRHRRAR